MLNLKCYQKRQHYNAKTTNVKLYIYIGVGTRDMYIDEEHMALDRTYSALRYSLAVDFGFRGDQSKFIRHSLRPLIWL